MVNLRPRPKVKAVALGAPLKTEPADPVPSMAPNASDLSEATLRKLPRAGLQKVAMAHKVKANMKSELIIQQLLRLQTSKRTRPTEDDPEEGPSQKRIKSEAAPEKVPTSPVLENQTAQPSTQSVQDAPAPAIVEDSQPEARSSTSPGIFPAPKTPTVISYDRDLFSSTESEMTEEEQLDFATPVSSRSGAPPAANVNDLRRCVTIMQEISAKDVSLLNEATVIRETAAKLRKRARDVRDLVKAETGRRERMEAYFRYWQDIEPTWHRNWLYGEKTRADDGIGLAREEVDALVEQPTTPGRQNAQGAQKSGNPAQQATPGPARRPTLSPGELKRKKQAIIVRQEAEQRELEALWRREMLGENSSREGSGEEGEASSSSLDFKGPSSADLPSADESNVKMALIGPFENSIGTSAPPAPSP